MFLKLLLAIASLWLRDWRCWFSDCLL